VDELGPQLDGVRGNVERRVRASADAIARFEDRHRVTGVVQCARGGQSRRTGADHEHVAHVLDLNDSTSATVLGVVRRGRTSHRYASRMRYVEAGGARLSVIGLGTWQF